MGKAGERKTEGLGLAAGVAVACSLASSMSHLHPVHPESLKMLLEAMGFVDVAAYGLVDGEDGEDGRAMAPLQQPDFETHEAFLSSPRDYVVVARKP